ncbi:MAG: hypothetical protein HPY65_17975 [Syntrophaceae bacterium]|nr:hypothetical protein [Syntrophaceae bacterium]
MDRPKTFEVAVALIMGRTGKNKVSAMEEARDSYPDLFLEFSARMKAGGPDYFAALGIEGKETTFEQAVSSHYQTGKSKADSVKAAMQSHPEAYQKYLLRLRNGEHVRFDLNR